MVLSLYVSMCVVATRSRVTAPCLTRPRVTAPCLTIWPAGRTESATTTRACRDSEQVFLHFALNVWNRYLLLLLLLLSSLFSLLSSCSFFLIIIFVCCVNLFFLLWTNKTSLQDENMAARSPQLSPNSLGTPPPLFVPLGAVAWRHLLTASHTICLCSRFNWKNRPRCSIKPQRDNLPEWIHIQKE